MHISGNYGFVNSWIVKMQNTGGRNTATLFRNQGPNSARHFCMLIAPPSSVHRENSFKTQHVLKSYVFG